MKTNNGIFGHWETWRNPGPACAFVIIALSISILAAAIILSACYPISSFALIKQEARTFRKPRLLRKSQQPLSRGRLDYEIIDACDGSRCLNLQYSKLYLFRAQDILETSPA